MKYCEKHNRYVGLAEGTIEITFSYKLGKLVFDPFFKGQPVKKGCWFCKHKEDEIDVDM